MVSACALWMQSSEDESEYSDTDSESSSEGDWNDGEFVRARPV